MVAKSSTADTLPNPFLIAAAAEAKDAGLRYTSDEEAGIHRQKAGQGFSYFRGKRESVGDEATLKRIKRLVIPPAWTDVWICPHANGHLQATGRDARGRKQYRYHEDWRQQRDESKFGRMTAFARVLPRIRRRVRRDLARRGMPREKVLATVVRLLEVTLIRVGNDEYARENHSYGLTTMRNGHARVAGQKIRFAFSGKSGKRHDITLHDAKLARIVRRCQDLPGQKLFSYEDEEGRTHSVHSQDVNDYIRGITGQDFTAKDFRTWAGTVLAAIALQKLEAVAEAARAKKNVVDAIQAVARMLGNTPAVCRKSYVHPGILESYLAGATIVTVRAETNGTTGRSLSQLKPAEAAVLMLLQRRLGNGRNGKNGKRRAAPIGAAGRAAAREAHGMPEKKTITRARRKKSAGQAPSTQAGEFVREEIELIRKGAHGARSAKQAIAIGLSKARRAGVKLAPPKKGSVSEETRKKAARDVEKAKKGKAAPVSRKRSQATLKALRKEGTAAVSKEALARQTKSAARRRSPAERSAAAKKAARTRQRK